MQRIILLQTSPHRRDSLNTQVSQYQSWHNPLPADRLDAQITHFSERFPLSYCVTFDSLLDVVDEFSDKGLTFCVVDDLSINHKLMSDAVEWLTADQPSWWYEASHKERYDFAYDLISGDPDERTVGLAAQFAATEAASTRFLNWYDGLPEIYDCMKQACGVGLRAIV